VAPSLSKSLPLPKVLRRILAELVIADRERRRGSGFQQVSSWPERIEGFEDLAFLFSSSILAHGVASLRFDEAAYLYRLVRELQGQTVVEIGRFRGGSTLLIAAALVQGVVHSYDIETRQGRDGAELDRELVAALERYGLSDRTRLHVGDSRTAEPPEKPIDLLFIDGDHREEGVRADYERWSPLLSRTGHLVFHDAVDAADLVPPYERGPARVATQVGEDFERRAGAGSLAHFARRS
jgi:predicted O-methyltransferase YrrM